MDIINRSVIRSLWGCQHLDWLFLGSIGFFWWCLSDVGWKGSRQNGGSSRSFFYVL